MWEGQPICLQRLAYPSVTGTGKHSIEVLAQARLEQLFRGEYHGQAKGDVNSLKNFLEFNGKSLNYIPKVQEQCAIDFRYGSYFSIPQLTQEIDLKNPKAATFKTQLEQLALALSQEKGQQALTQRLLVVDAVIDAKDKLWYLELEAEESVHPFVYTPMLKSLLKN